MIQNSAYVNMMLDGASQYADHHIEHHQAVSKPIEDSLLINNNVANYANLNNSGYPYQMYIGEQPAPVVAQDGYTPIMSIKNTEEPPPMGFYKFAQNFQIITKTCSADSIVRADTIFSGESSEEKLLLAVDQKPFATPAAAGELDDDDNYEPPRPMNAFLIFCNRHRAMLTHRFPQENRAISTKLGSWWRGLNLQQKAPFRELAKEHRDNYTMVIPNYRWCKQKVVSIAKPSPARSIKREPFFEGQDNRESLEAAESLVQLAQGTPLLSTFRLANESDMGSLNDLCSGGNVSTGRKEQAWMAVKVEQEERKVLAEPTPATSGGNSEWSSAADGRIPARATRSCKGKKYQELMSLIYPNTKASHTKRSPSKKHQNDTNQKSPKVTAVSGAETQTGDSPSATVKKPKYDRVAIEAVIKQLHDKIPLLPAMNLDDFCDKLDSEKNRKKSYSKIVKQKHVYRSKEMLPAMVNTATVSSALVAPPCSSNATPPSAAITQPAVSTGVSIGCSRPAVNSTPTKIVGCRKRKAPKECITRNLQPSVVEQ